MCRLRVLEINIDLFLAGDFDILSSLIRSLRLSLTSPATLEHLMIDIVLKHIDKYFHLDWSYDDLRDADVWSHLDSIITHPTGSRLQRVDISIEYPSAYTYGEMGPDDSETVLDALPLLREKGILFVEATTDDGY